MHITEHAKTQAQAKGWTAEQVYLAAVDPDVSYPSRNHPGQERRIRDGLVAVVDPVRDAVITVYLHCERTPLRADQRTERPAA